MNHRPRLDGFNADGGRRTPGSSWLSRRQMLQRAGTGIGMLGLANVLAGEGLLSTEREANARTLPSSGLAPKPPHFAPRAKRFIHLYMNGGPSQVDTFDYKPALSKYEGQRPEEVDIKTLRSTGELIPSLWKFNKYGQSGLWVSDLFPHVASCIDDICVIRSMHTDIPEHAAGMLMMNLGSIQPNRPSLGSWLSYGLGSENDNLPGFVVLCHRGKPRPSDVSWSSSFLPGIHSGTFVDSYNLDPQKVISDIQNPYLSRAEQRDQLDLLQQMNQLHLERLQQDQALEAKIESLELAYRMQFSAPEVFDISQESQATLDLYGIGDTPTFVDKGERPFGGFAESCLLARRLSERGVRAVQLAFAPDIPWDDHEDIRNHEFRARDCDRAIAALLQDLKGRGLLDETLVLWGGEFGRTPVVDMSGNTPGRDHNHYGFTVWMAGGGVRGGMTYGATDDFGFRAVENRLHVHDLHATILYAMGLDHEALTYRFSGRDFRLTDVSGRIVKDIFT